MGNITIECAQCRKTKLLSTLKFSTFFLKKVKIMCDHCGYGTPVLVTQEFLNGEQNKEIEKSTEVIHRHKPDETLTITAFLEVKSNKVTDSQILKLSKGENIIGRFSDQSENLNKRSIKTLDKKISRSHFSIILDSVGGHTNFWLQDLNSVNGTYLNGSRLSSNDILNIANGDTIEIGNTKIAFKTK